jgi:hypothetical protein
MCRGESEDPVVPRAWPNSTVVCLGTGPSLTADDVASCRGHARVIAVNDAYRLAPWADVLYACDAKWWRVHPDTTAFAGPKYGLQPVKDRDDIVILKNTGRTGLERDPTGLRTGSNSGYQAINLAVHFGAIKILLLGYDMGHAPGSRSHFFGDHPSPLSNRSPYATFIALFAQMVAPLAALGVEVINCSRATALTCFRRASLAEALSPAVTA